MAIEVLAAGLQSGLYNRGLTGYRSMGVPLSGAMDRNSARRANLLVGNHRDAVVLEFMLSGPVLHFTADAIIAVTGARFDPICDGVSQPMDRLLKVSAGSLLKLGRALEGCRGYLAIAGGFDVALLPGRQSNLSRGMLLKSGGQFQEEESDLDLLPTPLMSSHIEAFPGPEFELLPAENSEEVFNADLTLGGASNRMACMLDHDLNVELPGIVTGPVQPGTVQLTPSGQLIALMRDAQTTGGYARVLQLSEHGINCLAQLRPGSQFRFVPTLI